MVFGQIEIEIENAAARGPLTDLQFDEPPLCHVSHRTATQSDGERRSDRHAEPLAQFERSGHDAGREIRLGHELLQGQS
jgi:hypothetical protein